MTIYLDHNATTPLDSNVLSAMLPYMREHFGNPSSRHRQGRKASAAIEVAREQVANLVSAHPSQVVFTSGGTEANNLALKGCLSSSENKCLFVGSTEHESVKQASLALSQQQGCKVIELPVTEKGLLSGEAIEKLKNARAGDLISIMLANNETGVIQPISSLYKEIDVNGAIIHTDAVQAAGKINLDFSELGVQLMTLSAHKIYGPKGVGALIRDKSVLMESQISGGGHESGLRSGTENIAGIVGFGVAAEMAASNFKQTSSNYFTKRERLEKGLMEIDGVKIVAKDAERLANTTCFTMEAIEGETMLMLLDKEGFSVASGSACSSHGNKPSHVLTAMGINQARTKSALRVSLGKNNSQQDIDSFLSVLKSKIARSNNVANNLAV